MIYKNLASFLCRFEGAKLQKNSFRMEFVLKIDAAPVGSTHFDNQLAVNAEISSLGAEILFELHATVVNNN